MTRCQDSSSCGYVPKIDAVIDQTFCGFGCAIDIRYILKFRKTAGSAAGGRPSLEHRHPDLSKSVHRASDELYILPLAWGTTMRHKIVDTKEKTKVNPSKATITNRKDNSRHKDLSKTSKGTNHSLHSNRPGSFDRGQAYLLRSASIELRSLYLQLGTPILALGSVRPVLRKYFVDFQHHDRTFASIVIADSELWIPWGLKVENWKRDQIGWTWGRGDVRQRVSRLDTLVSLEPYGACIVAA